MASERIARWLLERSRIDRRQFEEAVRAQGFFGGEIESHLLKLGHVSEADLGNALTEIFGVPYAGADPLRTLPQAAVDAVPHEVIARTRTCPFHREGNRLRVAMLNPRDRLAVVEIERASGLQVEPWVTTEYRLYTALERHFRIRVEGVKAVAPASPAPGPRPEGRDRARAEAPPRGEPSVGLDGRPLDAEADAATLLTAHDWTSSPAARDWFDASRGPAPAPTPAPEDRRSEAGGRRPGGAVASLDRLGGILADAANREEATEALLEFALSRGRRAALFAAGKDGIRGIAARGGGLSDEDARRVALPSDSGTVFDAIANGAEFFFGVVPPLPPNRDLYTAFGGSLPRQAMILPIPVKGRLAALLYVDAADSLFDRPDLATMRRAAGMAGLAFEALLIRSKLREG